MNSSTSPQFPPPLILSLICMVFMSYPGLPLLQSYLNSLSCTLLCSLSLYLRSPSLSIGCLSVGHLLTCILFPLYVFLPHPSVFPFPPPIYHIHVFPSATWFFFFYYCLSLFYCNPSPSRLFSGLFFPLLSRVASSPSSPPPTLFSGEEVSAMFLL